MEEEKGVGGGVGVTSPNQIKRYLEAEELHHSV
jgi:hypothetical protein